MPHHSANIVGCRHNILPDTQWFWRTRKSRHAGHGAGGRTGQCGSRHFQQRGPEQDPGVHFIHYKIEILGF